MSEKLTPITLPKKVTNHLEQAFLSEILIPVTLPEELGISCYSINNKKLLNYFNIGHFIDNILTNINAFIVNEGCKMHHNSIVTGVIKGSGIANFNTNVKSIYNCKVARNVYYKSRRDYTVYKWFGYPKALAQIHGAKTISGNKLLKYGDENI